MIADLPYMPWYPRDILASADYTMMSAGERLAYRELLDRCWLGGGRLPSDPAALRKLTVGKVSALVLAKFAPHPDGGGGLTNERLWCEMEAVAAKSNKQRGRALKRWQPDAAALPGQSRGNAGAMPDRCHSEADADAEAEERTEEPPLSPESAKDETMAGLEALHPRSMTTESPWAVDVVDLLAKHVTARCGRLEIPAGELAKWRGQVTAWVRDSRTDPKLVIRAAEWLAANGVDFAAVGDARQFGWKFPAILAAMNREAGGGKSGKINKPATGAANF